MINPSTKPSINLVQADPPKSVGKITIKKGGDTTEVDVNDGVSFILDFKGLTIPVFPVNVTLLSWQLTALGTSSGYPTQDNYTIPMTGDALGNFKVYFTGIIPFRSGTGEGAGVMYQAEIQVNGFAATVLTDVEIEIT